MRLLVINFEMDRLSRSMPWSQQVVNLLAVSCEQVVVLTDRVGHYDAPPNVHVEVVPVRPFGIPKRFGGLHLMNIRVYQLIRQYKLQACFIHMAMTWAYVLAPVLRLLRCPVLVWYAHGTVTPELRRAERAATRIVTSTPEGCRITSEKIRVIGQGVDTDAFYLLSSCEPRTDLIAVSRIAPRKRIELLIEIMQALRVIPGTPHLALKLIGTTILESDQQYEFGLREQVWSSNLEEQIQFAGYIPQPYIPRFYRNAFLHINVSQTGSMDKTVLEALACGCPVLTGNEAFFELLKDYPEFIIHNDRPQAIASQVLELYKRRTRYDPQVLRNLVVGHHDIHSYVSRVLKNLEEITR